MANTVTTRDTNVPGIWVSQARSQLLLSGATPNNGGTDATWYAGELLLAALNTCATSLLHAAADERGWTLEPVRITADSERDSNAPDHSSRLHLHFEVGGVDDSQAVELVDNFKSQCPIYGTVSRGAPTTVSITTVSQPSPLSQAPAAP